MDQLSHCINTNLDQPIGFDDFIINNRAEKLFYFIQTIIPSAPVMNPFDDIWHTIRIWRQKLFPGPIGNSAVSQAEFVDQDTDQLKNNNIILQITIIDIFGIYSEGNARKNKTIRTRFRT